MFEAHFDRASHALKRDAYAIWGAYVAFRKGKEKLTAQSLSPTEENVSYFGEKSWKTKPYPQAATARSFRRRRPLLNHFSNCDLISASSLGMSRFLLFFISSSHLSSISPSLHLSISSDPFPFFPFLHLIQKLRLLLLYCALLFFISSSHLSSISPSLHLSISTDPFLSLSHLSSSLHPKTTPSAPLCFLIFFFI